MEDKIMNKTYIFLLILLVFIMTALVGLLVYRAYTNDRFFSEQESLEMSEI
ncbi:MAG: hypothetical protein UV00_C0003G0006 [candidate division WWE3 bacterium GW2011_GWF1_42_14]|uniref:Uncharacterized protein n=2 Tax=Katanobacteria TaxID=422282 RepID=A0A0G0YRD9_UNCKA|nr:MAG: hypothetical protein UU92_C0005G0005 [candidate division WWE3 bacterium GW2011_GWA1_42_12]KKS34241.1 MAG: hypothetical protein UU97_C0013G0015 [candidate division WWE3 bacterium GW2011_GWD1_42_14]KKS39174.1 MAG: hypothetical protein UV00_C0003G0006 [candidate division WWE3 bacterium GW2011_GWF1_42_14]KKS40105.1 MAG: hypothetical protein UV03_C0012G0016 [candidate division WWE3 bacterium GW2011_GWE1_42_16]KKS66826.1 MAG: hypothetical protein UV35_C0006G0005 [candidate division WWE3 bacte